jgi:hypothetical protein
MLHNVSESVARDILDTVVDNGRVLADGDLLDRDSLKVEIEFEAGERGIDSDAALEEIVSFVLGHSETN